MNMLALDLGTQTGFAFGGALFEAGTWELATKKEITTFTKHRMNRRRDPRIIRLHHFLLSMPSPDIVVFEDVQFASSTYQVQLWASLRAAVWLTFPHAVIDCVPVGTLKLFATGHGGATKPMMTSALKRAGYWQPGFDDDAVDAAWVWLWGMKNLGRMKI